MFAAAAYVDAALCAARELQPEHTEHVLEDVRFERALVVRKEATPMLMLDLQHGDGSFGVFARHDDQPWERHGSGRMLPTARYAPLPALDVTELARQLGRALDLDSTYARLRDLGLEYGPEFRRLASLHVGEAGTNRMLARLDTSGLEPGCGSLHPTLLDSAFHGVLAAVDGMTRAMVPVAIERVRLLDAARLPAFAYATWGRTADQSLVADVALVAEDGSPVLEVRGVTCHFLEQVSDVDAAIQASWLHLDTFEPQVWPAPAQARGQIWALAGSAEAYLDALGGALDTIGIASRPLAETDPLAPFSKVVVAFAADPADPAGIAACAALQGIVAQLVAARCSLRVLTFGARQLGDADEPCPAQSALLGLARVIMTEHPELATRIVDLHLRGSAPTAELLALLDADDAEEETAVRGDALYARRLRRHDPGYLRFGSEPGSTPMLSPRRNEPAADQLEVELLAASIEADEARPGSALLPDRPRLRSFVGRVVRVGAEVEGVAVGDIVQFVKRGTFGSACVDRAEPRPAGGGRSRTTCRRAVCRPGAGLARGLRRRPSRRRRLRTGT